MPPKASNAPARPQHARQPSTTKADNTKNKQRSAAAMPPPPDPPKPKPEVILGPELDVLEDSMKAISVKTAQVFKYYADVKKLGVQRHVPRQPRSLTSSLGTELARYDQICDSLDSQLTRAIAVLQRDLTREEKRIQEEELEKARAAAAVVPLQNDGDTDMTNASEAQSETEAKTRQSTPVAGKPALRRPSKISLSTLHRNPFPLKLDLSSTSLRLDESALSSFGLGGLNSLGAIGGLASPVTLAPKSARPMAPGELTPEILAALATATSNPSEQDVIMQDGQRIEIDLTSEEELRQHAVGMDVLGLGSGASADEAIDVDMDLNVDQLHTDVFGDEQVGDKITSGGRADIDDLFSPVESSGTGLPGAGNASTEGLDMSILNSLSDDHSHTDALFASLDSHQTTMGNEAPDGPIPGFSSESAVGNPPFDYSQLGDMEDFLKNAANEGNVDVTQFLGTIAGSSKVDGSSEEAKDKEKTSDSTS